MSKPLGDPAVQTYRIGAVSRLTGIAPDTLRVWERRYGAVSPFRSGSGARLYRFRDVERLSLIKRLVDQGDAMSTIANLDLDQLQERARGLALPELGPERGRPCRVVVLGTSLPVWLEGESIDTDGVVLAGLFQDRAAFQEQVSALDADVLILELPTLQPEHIRDIGTLLLRSGAARAVVVYGFAARATLERLESPRILPVRGPAGPDDLRRWCLALWTRPVEHNALTTESGIDISGPLPARRFDAGALARIAAASTTVRCECPQHLVDLISRLTAFESYSEECEVRNLDDAALHAFLHAATARARDLLETALERVIEADRVGS